MKYIKKVIIENFQSHKYSEINFDADLNIIIGQSDKGKSAILRALKWVLYNEPRGTEFVRYGTNECTVTIFMGDGYIVSRKRKKTKNIYTVVTPNGESLEFENFGNEVPPEVVEATGVKKVKLDTDKETKLNFNEQLDPPFLLAETGTIRAKSIGRIVNTNIIDAAERDIMKDISNNNVSIKNFERQLEEIETELQKYADINIQEQNVNKIEYLLGNIEALNNKLQKLNGDKNRLSSIVSQISNNQDIIKNLKNVSILSDKYNILKDTYNLFEQLNNFNHKLSLVNEQYLHNKNIIEKLKDISKLNEYISTLKEKFWSLEKLKDVNSKIIVIDTNIEQNKNILEKVKHIDNIENNIKTIKVNFDTVEKLSTVNNKLIEINSSISKGNIYLVSLIKELKLKVSDYSKSLKELGKCPTCYSIISESTVCQIINEMDGVPNGN